MASLVYNAGKKLIADGALEPATDTLKCALLMTGTTCDAENDAIAHVEDFADLDECDATGYARVALASVAVAQRDADDAAEIDAADIAFNDLSGDATRNYQGLLLYLHVTDDADSIPLAYIEFSSAASKLAVDVLVQWGDDGILRLV